MSNIKLTSVQFVPLNRFTGRWDDEEDLLEDKGLGEEVAGGEFESEEDEESGDDDPDFNKSPASCDFTSSKQISPNRTYILTISRPKIPVSDGT